jgi:hypothetical protein
MNKLIFILILSLPYFSFGQKNTKEDSLILLKPIDLKTMETEFEIREKERIENKKYNDSIANIKDKFYKSDYCMKKSAEYNVELKKYNDYEDSLVKVVKKFNLTESEYNYYMEVAFPMHCTGIQRDRECNFYRLDLSEKASIRKVYKFGNKDGSSGDTFYRKQ